MSGWADKPVTDLDLQCRALRTVRNLGCATIGDITRLTEAELLSQHNFGTTSLGEIKVKLSTLGMALADAPGATESRTSFDLRLSRIEAAVAALCEDVRIMRQQVGELRLAWMSKAEVGQ